MRKTALFISSVALGLSIAFQNCGFSSPFPVGSGVDSSSQDLLRVSGSGNGDGYTGATYINLDRRKRCDASGTAIANRVERRGDGFVQTVTNCQSHEPRGVTDFDFQSYNQTVAVSSVLYQEARDLEQEGAAAVVCRSTESPVFVRPDGLKIKGDVVLLPTNRTYTPEKDPQIGPLPIFTGYVVVAAVDASGQVIWSQRDPIQEARRRIMIDPSGSLKHIYALILSWTTEPSAAPAPTLADFNPPYFLEVQPDSLSGRLLFKLRGENAPFMADGLRCVEH